MCFSFGNKDMECLIRYCVFVDAGFVIEVLMLSCISTLNLIIVMRTKSFFYWENSKFGSIRGYINLILSYFCLFSEIFCLFLQFSTLESCYIWFTISLEYPSAYVHSCSPGKILIQGLSGGFRGSINPILSHFSLFSVIFCLFLQFSTLESCYIWFPISLEYASAYVYNFSLGKFKIRVSQGVSVGA